MPRLSTTRIRMGRVSEASPRSQFIDTETMTSHARLVPASRSVEIVLMATPQNVHPIDTRDQAISPPRPQGGYRAQQTPPMSNQSAKRNATQKLTACA